MAVNRNECLFIKVKNLYLAENAKYRFFLYDCSLFLLLGDAFMNDWWSAQSLTTNPITPSSAFTAFMVPLWCSVTDCAMDSPIPNPEPAVRAVSSR